MNQIKILHCADLHLGAELSSLGTLAKQRREELLMNFYQIISLCKQENIELLLIAGDLFENTNTDKNTVNSVKQAFSQIPDTIVAIAPGNHDYVSIDSPYTDADWPVNVVIFQSELESILFKEKNLCLWGAGFTSTYVTESLLSGIQVNQDSLMNICVMHGDVVAENQASNYNPISTTQIRQSGLDYLALGHIHKRTELLKSGATFYAYPGCPEGKGFDELGEKGVFIGTVEKGRVELSFQPINKRMNVEVAVDVTGATTNNEIASMIKETIKQNYGEKYAEHLYKVILEGGLDDGFSLDCVAIKMMLQDGFYYIKIKDETHILVDFDALSKETSLKGIFVRKMLEKINQAQQDGNENEVAMLDKALQVGMKAFDGEVILHENE